MPQPLPRSRPIQQEVDPGAVLGFLDAVEADPLLELHSLMVVRHGHVVAEGWWAPYTADRRHQLHSLSKSFTSTAVGLAQQEGLLHLDDLVLHHFPELAGEVSDERSRRLTLRHLAAMASGHTRDVIDDALARDPHEPVRGFLLTPPDREPGSVFAYNQPCTYTLAAVVQRRAGMLLTDYLRPRLFEPLGIDEVGWTAWPPGRQLGFTGLHARTEDVAKLGLLHLQRGRWADRQLVPEEWVAAATRKQVDNPDEPNVDWRQGYGYQFWMARHGYRGDGAFGQFCVVLPEQDTVIATTGYTEEMQAVLDAVWTHLLPGLGNRTGDLAAQERLDERLRTLRLAPSAGSPAPGDPASWEAGAFTFIGGRGAAHSALRTARLVQAASGPILTLTEDHNELEVAVGPGDWLVTSPTDRHGAVVPVAAAGAWVDDHTFRASAYFLETPHRLELTLSLPGREATAIWPHPPLRQDSIEHLHCP